MNDKTIRKVKWLVSLLFLFMLIIFVSVFLNVFMYNETIVLITNVILSLGNLLSGFLCLGVFIYIVKKKMDNPFIHKNILLIGLLSFFFINIGLFVHNLFIK